MLGSLGSRAIEQWITLKHPVKDKKTKQVNTVEQGKVLVVLRENPKFVPGNWIPINDKKIRVGLAWDFVSRADVFDLDASILAFDGNLNPEDNCFYGKKEIYGGAIEHMGDDRTGEGSGDDEVIKVNLEKIPKNIMALAVTVHSYSKKSMIHAKSAYIRIFTKEEEIGKFILAKTKDCIGLLLGLFERKIGSNEWYFRVMVDPIEGNHIGASRDSIKEILTGYSLDKVDTFSSSAVSRHPFPGEAQILPGNWIPVKCAVTNIGLGWDFQPGQVFDLDASAISFDGQNNVLDIIFHKNPASADKSIVHRGDNRTGAGEGDDEILTAFFPQIHPSVCTIAILINSFKGNSLIGIKSAFVRLFDECGPIGIHMFDQSKDSTGLLLGLFRKDPSNGAWFFQVMIESIRGVVATESVGDVKFLLDNYILPPPKVEPPVAA